MRHIIINHLPQSLNTSHTLLPLCHMLTPNVQLHACRHTYVSTSKDTFTTRCDEDTAWTKPNIRNSLWVWTEKSSIFTRQNHNHHRQAHPNLCMRGCAPKCEKSEYHVNILFRWFTLASLRQGKAIPSRVNYFGNALKANSSAAIKHCIIISQSQGSVHGLCVAQT